MIDGVIRIRSYPSDDSIRKGMYEDPARDCVKEDKAPAMFTTPNSVCMTFIRSADSLAWKFAGSECDRALLGIFKKENYKEGRPKEPSRGYKGLGSSLERASGQIQDWIEKIPVHVQKVIQLEGGNEYKEGKE